MLLRPIGAATLLLFALAAPCAPAWAQSASDSSGTGTATPQAQSDSGASTPESAPETEAAPEAATEAATDTATPTGDAAFAEKGYAMGDVVLGDPDAPLTVIEYASLTCPHCGNFAVHTFPKVKEEYIDTGKVKFILREVYFDQYGLWASMVARCGGEKGFYPLADTYLTTQSTWTRAPDIGSAIQQIGRRAGLSASRLEQCLSDRDYAKQLLADYQRNIEADEVKATPTFIIGGEKADGGMSYEEFSELLDAKL